PRQAKEQLGKDIVSFYHGAAAAEEAAAEWTKRFSGGQDPTEIPTANLAASALSDGRMPIAKLLVALGLASSNNGDRRHIQGGAVTIGPKREKISDPNAVVEVTEGLVVRVGKRQVVRVHLT